MTISDEDLMDYADGLLNSDKAAEVERAIAQDQELFERVEQFRTSFAMATAADDFAQSTFPTLEEIETELATRGAVETPASVKAGFLQTLRVKIIVAAVSLSVTFAGGVAATVGYVGWRVQQALMSIQTVGQTVAPMVTRGSQETHTFAQRPIWYVSGPLSVSIEVLDTKGVDGNIYRRSNGYLTDRDRVPVGKALKISYRIDERKFFDAQGFWCLLIGDCKVKGILSLDYKTGIDKFKPLVTHEVIPGETQAFLYPMSKKDRDLVWLTRPLGMDQLRLRLKIADDQAVETTLKIRVVE
jgi:hypothetical protein